MGVEGATLPQVMPAVATVTPAGGVSVPVKLGDPW